MFLFFIIISIKLNKFLYLLLKFRELYVKIPPWWYKHTNKMIYKYVNIQTKHHTNTLRAFSTSLSCIIIQPITLHKGELTVFDYYIVFWENNFDKFEVEEQKMCKKLDELSKLKIMDLYDLFEDEYTSPPINIHRILDKLQIGYFALDFSTLDCTINGVVLPEQAEMVMGAVAAHRDGQNKDTVEITVNSKDNYHRQRFTLAHELAHCMLHSDSLINGSLELRTAITTTEPREREANILAGEILIPEKLLKSVLKNIHIPLLPILAKEFDVSENVMEARLRHLGIGYYTL